MRGAITMRGVITPHVPYETKRRDAALLYIMYIIGDYQWLAGYRSRLTCPVTANMSFDSHLVALHVVVPLIMSPGACVV
jgi:hypothetical protein